MTARCGFLVAVIAIACLTQHVSSEVRYIEKAAKDRAMDGRYIVCLKHDEDHTMDVDAFKQEFFSQTTMQSASYEIVREYPNLNALAVMLSENAKKMIMEDPNVELIEDDGLVSINSKPRPPRPRPPPRPTPDVPSWGLDRIDQRDLPLDDANPPVYQGEGKGVHIYVLDSVISKTHEEFIDSDGASRVSDDGFDAFADDIVTSAEDDCNGHGTHVAATAAGAKYGVAKAATLHSIRVFDCDGFAADSDVISGIDWMLAAGNTVKPAVASMSFGGSKSETLNAAVQRLIDAGIVVSVAAGNSYSDACDYSPASVPDAITVGATERSDRKVWFSNYGACLDIFAPGSNIKSAWTGSDTATRTISGTSMACPHVSGAAAILLGIAGNEGLTSAEMAAKLDKLSTKDKVFREGTGSPNRLLYIGSQSCTDADGNPINDDILISDSDPCLECRCENGEKMCISFACEAPPNDNCRSIPVDGQCCPRWECPEEVVVAPPPNPVE